jgi:hypothetical protein
MTESQASMQAEQPMHFVLQAIADVDAGGADLHAHLQSTQSPRPEGLGSAGFRTLSANRAARRAGRRRR